MQIAILTRPEGRNSALAEPLRQRGWQVLELPALRLSPLPVIPKGLPLPEHYDLVVFVSGFAAKTYIEQWRDLSGQASWPLDVPIATVGPASAAAVRALPGVGADTPIFCPTETAVSHDSEALWDILRAQAWRPSRVLIVRGTQGRDWLGDQFDLLGVSVDRHAAYQRGPAVWPEAARRELQAWAHEGQEATWLITSGEGLAAISAQIQSWALHDWWGRCHFVVTHSKLARQLHQAGGIGPNAVVKTCLPTEGAMLAAFVAP